MRNILNRNLIINISAFARAGASFLFAFIIAGCASSVILTDLTPRGYITPSVAPTRAENRVIVDYRPQPPRESFKINVYFRTGSSVLNSMSRKALDDLSTKIKYINLEAILSTGHSDAAGSSKNNERLSLSRAKAVNSYLFSKGIENKRILAEGKGESSPAASNHTAAGRAKNRRVVVEVFGYKKSS